VTDRSPFFCLFFLRYHSRNVRTPAVTTAANTATSKSTSSRRRDSMRLVSCRTVSVMGIVACRRCWLLNFRFLSRLLSSLAGRLAVGHLRHRSKVNELNLRAVFLQVQQVPYTLRRRRQRDPSHPSRQMSSSQKPLKEKTHWCSCARCHGRKAVSMSTFYNHGNSVKRTPQSISERTKDLIRSLPQTSKTPRTRRPRKRRAEEALPADGDPAEGSKRVNRSDSVFNA
jgi:hypothetical protein